MLGRFEVEVLAGIGDLPGNACRWKKGIVERADEESGDADIAEIGLAAGFFPIVAGVVEAIQRCGETVIEFGEGLDGVDVIQIKGARELLIFDEDLFFEPGHEATHVDPILPFSQLERAGSEVTRGGECHGGFDLGGSTFSQFAEVLENDVPAEAESDERDVSVVAREGVINDVAQVFADSAVIGAEEAVRFATASTAVPGEGVPTSFLKSPCHALDVFRLRFTFEPVPDDGEALVA